VQAIALIPISGKLARNMLSAFTLINPLSKKNKLLRYKTSLCVSSKKNITKPVTAKNNE
jgi:hypothetical protein